MVKMKEGDLELLQELADYEASLDMSVPGMNLGWSFRDVRIQPAVLNRLFLEGYLDNPFKSNSYTGYFLSEKGKLALTMAAPVEEAAPEPRVLEIPDDLFDVIEGYPEIKDLIMTVLQSDKPVHLLFTGVPSSAKTMFLLELARLGAPYILGSQATKAGLAAVLFDTEPEILLVDEVDRINSRDIAVLLSLMETGIVSETKYGKRRLVKIMTRVFATSNTTRMPPELLSRFMVLRFAPYSYQDFLTVASNVLVKREGVDKELG
ncbi:MAG TPA: AAA family ATPase, partial [Dehalococcoidia bacterium]|nr:AAA family ATPase [Dehalococcoidia bacterium]